MSNTDNDGAMTIEDFVASIRGDIAKFEANWKAQAKVDPKNWPAVMNEGDWYDQFLIFEASGDKS